MAVLLYSGETWTIVQQHISPLAVFRMNCLRRICGMSLHDHEPKVNTLSLQSQLQGKRLRWLGHVFRVATTDGLRSFCLVKSSGFAHLAALGLVSMLRCVIAKFIVLVDLIQMRKTDCFRDTQRT